MLDARRFDLMQKPLLFTPALAVVTPSAALAGPPAENLEAYCARAGNDDRVKPIPPGLVAQAARLFYVAPADAAQAVKSTVYRCMSGALWLCNYGANLSCAKADTSRSRRARRPGARRIRVPHSSRWRRRGTTRSTHGNASARSRASPHLKRSTYGVSSPISGGGSTEAGGAAKAWLRPRLQSLITQASGGRQRHDGSPCRRDPRHRQRQGYV